MSTKFVISDEITLAYPELIKLIKNTESMDDKEKQDWFDILGQMNKLIDCMIFL